MPSRREDVDLWLVLASNPERARKYIRDFNWGCRFEDVPAEFTTDTGRMVNLRKMNDEEAMVVAQDLLRNYEINEVMASKRMAEALGQIC